MLQLFEYEKWRKWAAKDMSAASKESGGRWSQLLFGILVFNCPEQQKCNIFIFFFFDKIYWYQHPSTQGVNKGTTNQKRKLQESRKSKKEGKDLFCKANNQSNKVVRFSYFHFLAENNPLETTW